ncbi:conserved hypothetical protein [Candidatus Desulforudis audaxviator MP104C]|uniref:Uncharacterized protein n=1 Tax=Desulforudis audaxviator (strain MP104C) TaxID=477974 RepID=B1I2R7_DESAP|nr:hypothetical protein [Candidatus Desulforudis audaxviator]ACA59283.1 conserved hypothetical protein [Candidatus Desulforudis audaxviator MP104C]
MRGNSLWESHRIVLPELCERAAKRCADCRFFVRIQGREEARWGCVAGLPGYGAPGKLIPESLPAAEVIRVAGKDGLLRAVSRGDPNAQACGLFLPRCRKLVPSVPEYR